MVSIHKVVGVLSCGFVLCLALSFAAQAESAPAPAGNKIVTGKLLRIEDGNYVVKGTDGKEVRFHTDRTTQMIGQLNKGDNLEAKVNGADHAMVIRQQ